MSAGKRPLGGIEAGGTKFVLAIAEEPTAILARHTIPTTAPEETLATAARWFEDQGGIAALGIASFGPVDLDRASPRWGHITETPKPGWTQCDIAGFFARRLDVPVGFDTDVNSAALAEFAYGAGQGSAGLAYVTVGTGIGVGLVVNGKPVHGVGHPETGHIYPRRTAEDGGFAGICPHHGDCLEGLASGPAIKARWGASLSQLTPDHEAHAIIADYLAQLCHTLFATCAVETIVMGGGVMQTPWLLERIRVKTAQLGADYLPGRHRHAIVAPGLRAHSGTTGALVLAQSALGV